MAEVKKCLITVPKNCYDDLWAKVNAHKRKEFKMKWDGDSFFSRIFLKENKLHCECPKGIREIKVAKAEDWADDGVCYTRKGMTIKLLLDAGLPLDYCIETAVSMIPLFKTLDEEKEESELRKSAEKGILTMLMAIIEAYKKEGKKIKVMFAEED